MNDDKCALCEKVLGGEPAADINGRKTCAACRDAVLAEIAGETDAGVKLAPIIAIGAAASAACGAAWALLIVLTNSEIGFAAVGIGYAVGHAVRRAAGGKRGPRLQKVAVACSTLGLVLGKYFFAAHLVRREVAAQLAAMSAAAAASGGAPPAGSAPSWFDPRLVMYFFEIVPELVGIYDALWLFLALNAAWRVLQPAQVALSDGRNSPPAA